MTGTIVGGTRSGVTDCDAGTTDCLTKDGSKGMDRSAERLAAASRVSCTLARCQEVAW